MYRRYKEYVDTHPERDRIKLMSCFDFVLKGMHAMELIDSQISDSRLWYLIDKWLCQEEGKDDVYKN